MHDRTPQAARQNVDRLSLRRVEFATSMSDTRWRLLWLLAALHNFSGVLLFTVWHDRVYTSAGLAPPSPALHYDTWIAFVFVFGLAYFMVFRNLRGPATKGIVIVAILAKLASATPQLVYLLTQGDKVPAIFAFAALSDYGFVVFFVWFLRTMSPASRER